MFEILCAIPVVAATILGFVWLSLRIKLSLITKETNELYSRISDYKLKHFKPRPKWGLSNAYKRQLQFNNGLMKNRETLEKGLERYLEEFARNQIK